MAAEGIHQVLQQCAGKRWLKDIIPTITKQGADQLVERLSNPSRQNYNGAIIIGWHPEEDNLGHLHVYHACSFASSFCRCYWLRGYQVKSRKYQPIQLCEQVTIDQLLNILLYLNKNPRILLRAEAGGADLKDLVPSQDPTDYAFNCTTDQAEAPFAAPASSIVPSKRLQYRLRQHDQLVERIKQLACSPLSSTCTLEAWTNDPVLAFFDKSVS